MEVPWLESTAVRTYIVWLSGRRCTNTGMHQWVSCSGLVQVSWCCGYRTEVTRVNTAIECSVYTVHTAVVVLTVVPHSTGGQKTKSSGFASRRSNMILVAPHRHASAEEQSRVRDCIKKTRPAITASLPHPLCGRHVRVPKHWTAVAL